MRTKTLLIAAAALAAGVLSTQAQPVYSQNVVGYVNQVVPQGQSLIVNPLQGTTNGAEQILTGMQGGENIMLWAVNGYQIYNFNPGLQAQGYPSDWIDGGGASIPGNIPDPANGVTWVPAPQIAPGVGFFLVEGGNSFTNTYVGTVVLNSTNTLSGGQSLLGSTLPVAGDLETNSNINLPLQGGENILVWAGKGYQIFNYNAGLKAQGYPSDWIDGGGATIPGNQPDPANGVTWVPNPQVQVGQAFFYVNGNGATNWIQNLVLQ